MRGPGPERLRRDLRGKRLRTVGGEGTIRRSEPSQLDRRAFVRLSTCGAGVIWATPRIRSVAPLRAGTPPPSSAPPPPTEPPEVASELAAPVEPAVAPTRRAAPEVKGVHDDLAVTGTEIGQMTLVGIGAVVSGLGLRHVARRLEAAEPEGGTPPV